MGKWIFSYKNETRIWRNTRRINNHLIQSFNFSSLGALTTKICIFYYFHYNFLYFLTKWNVNFFITVSLSLTFPRKIFLISCFEEKSFQLFIFFRKGSIMLMRYNDISFFACNKISAFLAFWYRDRWCCLGVSDAFAASHLPQTVFLYSWWNGSQLNFRYIQT